MGGGREKNLTAIVLKQDTEPVHIFGANTFFQATDWQINDDKWELFIYPVSVTGAGMFGTFYVVLLKSVLFLTFRVPVVGWILWICSYIADTHEGQIK